MDNYVRANFPKAPSQARLARGHGMRFDRVRVTTLSTHESDRP